MFCAIIASIKISLKSHIYEIKCYIYKNKIVINKIMKLCDLIIAAKLIIIHCKNNFINNIIKVYIHR